ncbi:MAG TPA: hypothetical protein DCS07_18375 [Bdellovibrionales bacterium]|nr:MAG: hypothetical protein A2Z97_05750 [Bdellovibrionales bacterium GWB1_52_6]OFZ04378.1 MAG: hypothetical protein A2X97_06965 [Bdellovibrionales bacterium GWA1_52_35]OFZ38575.1 MAG: hypothetical protein A2070_09925 [Bdellovibrionales bacterium GWC1_52_8]HAR44570.1 hypothetical protein [Bdellovibrionales bacterium]HCM40766.1 hypothetical protein [Bdellovibrionales bacterium]
MKNPASNAPKDRDIQELLSKRDFPKAEALIRGKLQTDPHSADGYYFLGILFYFQGKLGPTVENLKKALELDPHHTDAAVCLSVLYNDVGKYDDAKNVFDRANQSVAHRRANNELEIDRKFAVKHLELADLYFRYRRFDEAIEEYGKAASLDPTTQDIRIRLAKAYAKKGFITRALQELQQLKADHPRHTPALLQLGLLHFSQGNVLDAELEWEAVRQVDPENREALAYLEMAKEARAKL